MVSDLIRTGVVTEVDNASCAVRVLVEDRDDLVTNWLPVVFSQTGGNKEYSLPDVDDSVICIFLGNGLEVGFCLGSIYTGSPPTSTASKRGVWFADGSRVEFDNSTGILTVDAKGAVKVTAAGGVSITGNLSVTGSISASSVSADSITRGGVPL